VLRVQ